MAPTNKPTIVPPPSSDDAPISIAKPDGFSLDKFKSKQPANLAGVKTLLTGLPCHRLKEANDFARLHSNEETHWSMELCFVTVPIPGQSDGRLHLITEELAMRYLHSGKIQHFRLALGSLPNDRFFLCLVPTRNLENNLWNKTNLDGCVQAKKFWVQLISRKPEGIDEYKIQYAEDKDAFPEPKWPTQTLGELIEATFKGRMIETKDDAGLKRLIGAKQSTS